MIYYQKFSLKRKVFAIFFFSRFSWISQNGNVYTWREREREEAEMYQKYLTLDLFISSVHCCFYFCSRFRSTHIHCVYIQKMKFISLNEQTTIADFCSSCEILLSINCDLNHCLWKSKPANICIISVSDMHTRKI